MSQVELYQSVLSKLGQLAPNDLAVLDAYLERLLKKEVKTKSKGISHLAGAWKDWSETEFQDFLRSTKQIRLDLFADRNVSI
ncbi:MAG: hypothetical protein WCR52_19500 [Bacteroidota bacterium]